MALLEETASYICHRDSEEEAESANQIKLDQEGLAQESVNQFKQLEMIFGSCQSLLSEMRDVTIQVAANILEADATKCQPRILEQQIQTLELQLLQEREQNTKKMQAMRLACQSQVMNMATTVKEYFKKTMEHTSSQHKKELERVHSEGIQEGMRRLRGILQNHMACTHCSSTTPRLFLCSGCWSACYCGEACQRKHWPIHMQTCGGLRSTSNSN